MTDTAWLVLGATMVLGALGICLTVIALAIQVLRD